VDWGDLTAPEQLVLADAQTSGGLLIASTQADRLGKELGSRGVPYAEIGTVEAGEACWIRVTGRLG
jgi:selenophosphate synthase